MFNKKWTLLLKGWGQLILAWLFIFYFYYIVVYWGTGKLIPEGEIKSYVFSYKAHIELILAAVFFGFLFGIIDTVTDQRTIRERSFTFIIIFKSILYLLSFGIASIFIRAIFLAFDIFPYNLINELSNYYNLPLILSFVVYFTAAIFLLNIALQVNKKFGPGELVKIIYGKYHKPREETRIFLLLDMRSSTAIAEKIGNITYSQLIRQCFMDLSDIILKYDATIYQHVGDEILLTWEKKYGIKNLNAIHLFFEFHKRLKKRNDYYSKKFGVIPEFKAALHMGNIVVAETGDLKREIAFHGDVMNTTARLEKQCNKYNENFLISESVKENIPINRLYSIHYLDEVLLRGKKNYVKIYCIHEDR